MKRTMKKYLCFVMMFVLLCSQTIIADAEILEKEIKSTVETFDTETGELIISGIGDVRSDISNMAFHIYQYYFPWSGSAVKTLVIDEGIYRIFPSSFEEYYTNLESVRLPKSLDEIGDRAFYGCTSLKEIYIPDDLYIFGKDCFTNTAAWNDESNFTDNIFYIATTAVSFKETKYDLTREIVIRDNTKVIAESLLKDMNIRSVTFPDGIEKIPNNVCNGCRYLVGAFIPDSVKQIGRNAFLNCNFLTIYCNEGSYAQQYAIENNIPYDTVNKDISNAITVGEINEIYREMIKTPEPTVSPTPDETPTPELKYGDVDNDGIVCAEDALLVLKHAAKLETLSDDAILVADVTQDETVDAEDALEILKYAAILIRDFN